MGDASDDFEDIWHRDDFESGDEDLGGRGRRRKVDNGYDLGQVEVIRETDNALLVRGEGLSSDPFGMKDPNEESWVPKSQIHPKSELKDDCGVGAKGAMTISKWLAEKRGLV